VDDESAQCGAALARGADRGKGYGSHGQIEISRLRYHHRVVPAEFEQGSAEPSRDNWRHRSTHAATAGGADQF